PDVPVLTKVLPSSRMPEPIAPHALSAPPANTRVLADNPVATATSPATCPTSSDEATSGGQKSTSIPSNRQISELHSFRPTSNNNVPAASEYSICSLPVSLYRT